MVRLMARKGTGQRASLRARVERRSGRGWEQLATARSDVPPRESGAGAQKEARRGGVGRGGGDVETAAGEWAGAGVVAKRKNETVRAGCPAERGVEAGLGRGNPSELRLARTGRDLIGNRLPRDRGADEPGGLADALGCFPFQRARGDGSDAAKSAKLVTKPDPCKRDVAS